MKQLLKRLAHWLLGDYALYLVLVRQPDAAPLAPPAAGFVFGPVTREEIAASGEALLREQAWYAGTEALAYGCWADGQLAALCFYWHGARYRQRGFWPLAPGEAKLVQIVTAPAMRGRKIAPALIAYSAQALAAQGFKRLFARVWHSNTPSQRAFAAAGWQRCALVLEINPMRRARPWRWRWHFA